MLADSGPGSSLTVIATDSDQAMAQPSFHLNDETRSAFTRGVGSLRAGRGTHPFT